jgi:hypothetical protein
MSLGHNCGGRLSRKQTSKIVCLFRVSEKATICALFFSGRAPQLWQPVLRMTDCKFGQIRLQLLL